MLSCSFSKSFNSSKNGNGNVITEDRSIENNFDEIKISQGLDLYITQSNETTLIVEADENLHDLIKTEIANGVLKIYSTENIRRASSKKVILSVKTISAIKATSGSDVYSNNTLEVSNLELTSTSGADIKLDIKTDTLDCTSTSGSDIKLSGSTKTLIASATSGSDIDASQLQAETSNVRATSGADISVNTSKALTAKATSGGDIRYSGNPEKISKSDTSAGRVKQQ